MNKDPLVVVYEQDGKKMKCVLKLSDAHSYEKLNESIDDIKTLLDAGERYEKVEISSSLYRKPVLISLGVEKRSINKKINTRNIDVLEREIKEQQQELMKHALQFKRGEITECTTGISRMVQKFSEKDLISYSGSDDSSIKTRRIKAGSVQRKT